MPEDAMSGIWMFADHTVDGRALTEDEQDTRPLVGAIEEPGTHDVVARDPRVCRFQGWVAVPAGAAAKVVVQVDGGVRREFEPDRPRPDVAEVMDLAGPARGFLFYLDLPGAGRDTVPITLELTDGKVVARTEPFRVRTDGALAVQRAAYRQVWDAVAADVERAKVAVSGYTDEHAFAVAAGITAERLRETVRIYPEDVVLEIGAGVGRVGAALAPACRRWIATDVSEHMLRHTRDRLAGFDNVETMPIDGWDLRPITSESIDVVYCTVVFMHLDEWDRFGYVREAMRVLRPGGRIYVDNFNLLGDEGWEVFRHILDDHHPFDRPPNVSKASTPQELEAYLERAGFRDVTVVGESLWVYAFGRKPPT